jgi:hypothetical protein
MKNSIRDFVSYEMTYHQKALEMVNFLDKQTNSINSNYPAQDTINSLINLFEDRDNKERIIRDDIQSYMTSCIS